MGHPQRRDAQEGTSSNDHNGHEEQEPTVIRLEAGEARKHLRAIQEMSFERIAHRLEVREVSLTHKR